MATKTVQDSSLTAVADAIRAKTGKSARMQFPAEFVSEIGSISGGGGASVAHGTFTPSARTQIVFFDTGLTTINGLLIVPHDETPLKSKGKTTIAVVITPNSYFKSFAPSSNNAGVSWLYPGNSTENTSFTQSGTVVTVYTDNRGLSVGYFETITYEWWAW